MTSCNQKDTGLLQGTLTPEQFVDEIKKVYDDVQAEPVRPDANV